MAAAKLFHSAGQQVTVPTYLVPATQKVCTQSHMLALPCTDVVSNHLLSCLGRLLQLCILPRVWQPLGNWHLCAASHALLVIYSSRLQPYTLAHLRCRRIQKLANASCGLDAIALAPSFSAPTPLMP